MKKIKKSTGLKTREGKSSKQETKGFYLMSEEEKLNYQLQLPKHKCPLCGKTFRGYGNNPRPLDIKGKVCDECNVNVIIPMRIMELYSQKRG